MHPAITLFRLLVLVLGLIPFGTVQAITRTATSSGNWTTAGIWNTGTAPAAGDIMMIPSSRTVTITANLSYTGSPMRIQVYGTLFFSGGGAKISMPCNSIVELMTPTATLAGDNGGSSQTVKICNATVWSVGADNNAHGYEAYPTDATLPVELLGFDGWAEDGGVELRWSTATERDNDHFTVERSSSGADFEPIITVAGVGNSQQVVDYGARDERPSGGVNHYRLKQTDLDGLSTYVAVTTVYVRPAERPVPSPNPFAEGLLTIPAPAGVEVRLSVLDLRGSTLLVRTMHADEQGRLQLPRSAFGALQGPCLVQVETAASHQAYPLLLD